MIYDKLYDWQKSIVDRNKSRSKYGLFLDCGLGKTPISLAFAEVNRCTKLLVVTINSKATEGPEVFGSWWQWGERSDVTYRIQNKTKLKSGATSDMLIINYEGLFERGGKSAKSGIKLKDYVLKFIADCKGHRTAIILDESHKVKNLQTLQTKAITEIIKTLQGYSPKLFVYLLTGTPFTTGFIDLYAQLKILGCPMTKTTFVDEFCIRDHRPGLYGWQQPIVGYKNVEKLYDIVHTYAITVKSKEVVNLPEQIFINHIQPKSQAFDLLTKERLPTDQLNKIRVARGIPPETVRSKTEPNPFYRNLAFPETDYFADTAGAFWLRARQCSIGFQGNSVKSDWYDKSRIQDLKRHLEQNEDNYIIFYNYTPELLELYSVCEELGYNIDVYCGELKSLVFYEKFCALTDAQKLITKKNVIIANFASGSTGMNWQEYNQCILFSLPLYKDWEQGLKRLHRIGQKHVVKYHLFWQDNWLEKGMKKALEENITYTEDMFRDGLKKESE